MIAHQCLFVHGEHAHAPFVSARFFGLAARESELTDVFANAPFGRVRAPIGHHTKASLS
jgi:hypothetical protein